MKCEVQVTYRLIYRFFLSLLLCGVFIVEPIAAATGFAASEPASTLSNDQKIAQVLSRLTFGARPGDFERLQQMGVKEYINAQLDPDWIDDSALDKRLEKLPTLNLITPTIAEQYNPPKPPPPPVPVMPGDIIEFKVVGAEQFNFKAAVNAEGKIEVSFADNPLPVQGLTEKDVTAELVKALSKQLKAPQVSVTVTKNPSPMPTPAVALIPKPSPTPTPKNPQMVVTDLQRAKLMRAVYSERQLKEVVVDFWENHFSIFANKDADRWLMTSFDRDTVRPFAFGRFRDLLGATAHSPAMLFYLDNWQSRVLREYPATKDKPASKSGGINENYARELMELHTMGVDGGYTQKDVQEVARCFTGWTIRKPNEEGLFVYNPGMHDNGAKEVLGQKIPAGGGIGDAERVLDILAKQPSTAHFIATKLARRLIGDDPPREVVDRAAKVFLQTDGSIRETLRAIIDSPEFLNPKSFQTKVRSPFEFVAASLRVTNAETDANRPILDWIGRMGQPLYGHLTPDGYPDQSNEWLSSNDLLARFNFAGTLTANKIPGTKIELLKLFTKSDMSGPAETVATVTKLMLMNQVMPKSRETLEKFSRDNWKLFTEPAPVAAVPVVSTTSPAAAQFVAPAQPKDTRADYLAQLMALTLGTPEFQHK